MSALGYTLSEGYRLKAAVGGLLLSGPDGAAHIGASDAVAHALSALDRGPAAHESLLSDIGSDNHPDAELIPVLERIAHAGALRRVACGTSGPLVFVEPVSRYYRLARHTGSLSNELRLSRFSYLRRDGAAMVMESPLCHSRVRLVDTRLAGVLASLSEPQPVDRLLGKSTCLDGDSVRSVLALLTDEGFIASPGRDGEAATDDTPALRQWEFHDLLFHSRTRLGRHRNPFGGTFRFRGFIPPRPALKPPMASARIALAKPDLRQLAIRDMSLTEVMERRASIRNYGAAPITAYELGELLYRAARVKSAAKFAGIEVTSRPYPNGGASYELELYVLADRCQGLQPGLFHYEPASHSLEPLTPASVVTEQFLTDAFVSSGQTTRPEVLIIITARFQRVSWKYASIAYSTILKNVGALYQTLYLVATAMSLGPCALGAGDSDRFSQVLGEDYYEETAVGEFMLGNTRTRLCDLRAR